MLDKFRAWLQDLGVAQGARTLDTRNVVLRYMGSPPN